MEPGLKRDHRRFRQEVPSMLHRDEHTPVISVIVVNYNGCEHIERCLNALERQTVSHEVIVVDNGSTMLHRGPAHRRPLLNSCGLRTLLGALK